MPLPTKKQSPESERTCMHVLCTQDTQHTDPAWPWERSAWLWQGWEHMERSGQHCPHCDTVTSCGVGTEHFYLAHTAFTPVPGHCPAVQLPRGSRRAPPLHMANPGSARGRARSALGFPARMGRRCPGPGPSLLVMSVSRPPGPAAPRAAHRRSAGPARGRSGSTGRTTLPPPPARSGAGAPAAAAP